MKVVLELQDQPSNIKKVTIRHDVVIGRGSECNLRLSSPQVSRRHCFLRISSDGASLTDLDSSNGTWLNDEKLTSGKRYTVEDGMAIAVGPVKFVARVESEIPVEEALQVHVQDDRVEAEFAEPNSSAESSNVAAGGNADATVAGPLADQLADADPASLNFAIEQGGPAASEDEPTADYVPSAESDNYFAGIDEIESEDPETIHELPDDEVVDVMDAEVVDVIDAEEDLAEIEDLSDSELIEDDELLEADGLVDDELIEVADEDLEGAGELLPDDDEELDVIDVDDDTELAASGEIEVLEADEIVELPAAEDDNLNDFLKGLS